MAMVTERIEDEQVPVRQQERGDRPPPAAYWNLQRRHRPEARAVIVASRIAVGSVSPEGYFDGGFTVRRASFGYGGYGWPGMSIGVAVQNPPRRPQLPINALSSAMARLRCVSSPYQVTRRPGWTSVAGRWRAISRAVSRIACGSIPVSAYAHSGV